LFFNSDSTSSSENSSAEDSSSSSSSDSDNNDEEEGKGEALKDDKGKEEVKNDVTNLMEMSVEEDNGPSKEGGSSEAAPNSKQMEKACRCKKLSIKQSPCTNPIPHRYIPELPGSGDTKEKSF